MELLFVGGMSLHDLEVVECGHQECAPFHAYGPAVRDQYLFHYIHQGKGVFRLGGNEYRLEAGQGFVIHPGLITHYWSDPEDPWVYSWIGFRGAKADNYLHKAGMGAHHPVYRHMGPDSDRIAALFSGMSSAGSLKRSLGISLLGTLYEILAICIEQSPEDSGPEDEFQKRKAYTSRAEEFIRANYAKNVRMRDIAAYTGVQEKYLCSLFKKERGTSPYHYLLNVRFQRAIELLSDPGLTIGDVARSVGYEDPLLFSKMFKRFKGLPPKALRKNFIS